jgi:hypothetical protein
MKSITRLSLALIMFSILSISYLVTSVSANHDAAHRAETAAEQLKDLQQQSIVNQTATGAATFDDGLMGAPGMGAPGMGAPGMGAPGMGAPGMGAPGMGAPGMGAPGMGAPGMGAPGMGAPGMGAPGMGAPGGHAPTQGKAPRYNQSPTGAPGMGAPGAAKGTDNAEMCKGEICNFSTCVTFPESLGGPAACKEMIRKHGNE